jgi:hypothetical protein
VPAIPSWLLEPLWDQFAALLPDRWRVLAQDEQDAAVTELRELAGGRADLLAEVAGIFEGASEGELDEPLARQAAQLCRLACADEALMPRWIEEGRRRAAISRIRPHSG